MATFKWTGQRMLGTGLLYQDYQDRADVYNDDDKRIGEVLLLPDGQYDPRMDGIKGENCETMPEAVAKVVAMWEEFRACR